MSQLDAVRHLIATALLDDDFIPGRIGEIDLRPHQRRAAARLTSLIAARGGAMLAEPVGVGKTYTALAVAARHAGPLLVVAPGVLRAMWEGAAERCAMPIDFISHESLSRGRRPNVEPGFVLVDEAHRVRTSTTKRYALLADICRRAPVLLVTATPVQNARDDLAAQLALFLGRAAWTLGDEQLVALVVRDSGSLLGARPRLDGPHRIELPSDDDCLDQLMALPAPIPARDESLAAALMTYGLLHQWTSSHAALLAALTRRRARGLALMSAVESGRSPTRAELAAWTHAGDAVQLAFPEIVASEPVVDCDSGELLIALDRHNAAVQALIETLRRARDPDSARADVLRRIRRSHPGERIIAFCHYAETVAMLRSKLARDVGVATLTASGARVAGGRITRDDVLAQFSPNMREPVRDAERIELLVTTDLLSEGLNLQEASVIVHLDLPWNPARLDQRVGRALRLGSRRPTVTVYAIAPPTSADRLLKIESRLRDKLRLAQRTIGVAGRILPAPLTTIAPGGLAEQRSEIEAHLRSWRETHMPLGADPVAAVECDESGFVALVRTSRGPQLIVDVGDGIETSTPVVARAISLCNGRAARASRTSVDAARASIDGWLATRHGADTVDLAAAGAARSRRATLNRVALAIARAPRHQRLRLAPLADAARSVASAPLGEGAERALEMLARADLSDEAWLQSIAAFGELNTRTVNMPAAGEGIIALILLLPKQGL
jgi:superfamily II DNA or RNA helicase